MSAGANAAAARLKLKRKTPTPAPAAPAAPAVPVGPARSKRGNVQEAPEFQAGESVLGNFKGLGDWDEALVMAVNPDGTYVLEYVDEGLIEEGVPAKHISRAGGANATATAAAVGDACPARAV